MMFATQLLLISLALAPLTYAQDAQLPIPCCNISPSDVSESDRNSWCNANQNSCVEACGGQGQIRSDGNTCNTETLAYLCRCNSGIQPDLRPYAQTVPGLSCQFWFSQCRAKSKTDAERTACSSARNATCGTKEVEAGVATKSTISARTSSVRLSSSSSATRSQSTFSSSTSTTPSTSPSNTAISQNSSVPVSTIVGAVVGSVGGIVVLVVLAFLYRRHQKSKIAVKQDMSSTTYEKPELHGIPAKVRRVEMPGGRGDDAYPYIARNVELPGEGCHGPLELTAATPVVEEMEFAMGLDGIDINFTQHFTILVDQLTQYAKDIKHGASSEICHTYSVREARSLADEATLKHLNSLIKRYLATDIADFLKRHATSYPRPVEVFITTFGSPASTVTKTIDDVTLSVATGLLDIPTDGSIQVTQPLDPSFLVESLTGRLWDGMQNLGNISRR